ncbi:MAG: hypothetical protein H6684_01415 [Deltaproteobacteria bacterium]|nr:hypothetical protein [Deltaproteobacteria bacterium]MCB9487370.1 hypothetical protein [Deltaproteobacteria bacterium]
MRITRRAKRRLILIAILIAAPFAVDYGFWFGYRLVKGDAAARNVEFYQQRSANEMIDSYAPNEHTVYTFSPKLPYVDESGFIAPIPKEPKKPGVLRVVAVGTSETAGQFAWPAHLHEMLTKAGIENEVWNLAVPGYTSMEGIKALRWKGFPMHPDFVIAGFGASELRAGIFPGFKDDYSHFRREWSLRPGLSEGVTPQRWLTIHSHLAAFLRQRKGLPPFAGRELDDYIIRYDVRPMPRPDFGDKFRNAFRAHMDTIRRESAEAGARTIFHTACHCDKNIPTTTAHWFLPGVKVVNEVIRSFPDEMVVDFQKALSGRCELFIDFIHTHPPGEQIKAEMMLERIQHFLEKEGPDDGETADVR